MSETKSAKRFAKPKKAVFLLGFAVVAVLMVLHATYHEPIDESFLGEYNDFDSYEQVNADPVVYHVFKEDAEVGYLVMESHYGYQSDIVMATLVGMDGTVLDARAYSQGESPSYFRKLIGTSFFKKNFVGDPIAEGFSISDNVDAVSHATISSNAATKAVQKGVEYVGAHYLDMPVVSKDAGMSVGYLDVLVFLMLVLALATSRFSKKKALVWACRVYSIVVMGFLASQFITLSVLVAFFSLDWPSVVDYLRWYVLVFGVLILILATGKNVYCSCICPFGALEEAVFAFGGTIGKKPLNPRVGKLLRLFPGILIFASLLLTLGFHNLDFANYEPFSLIFGQVGVGIQWVLLPLVLLGSLFSRRIYCNFACPVGYVLSKVVIVRGKVAKLFKRTGGKAEKRLDDATCAHAAGSAGEGAASAGDGAALEAARSAQKPAKTGRKPLKSYDWIVLILGLAIVVVSLLAIFNGFGSLNA